MLNNELETQEMLIQWWRQYGKWLMASVLTVIVLVVANQWWQKHQEKQRLAASVLYEHFRKNLADSTHRLEADKQANQLIDRYDNSPYAVFAHFYLATRALAAEQTTGAIQHLRAVDRRSVDKSLRQLARIRMARIYMMQKQWDQALKILEERLEKSYEAMIEELKGDIYLAKGQREKAGVAYAAALQATSPNTRHPLLVMKATEFSPAGLAPPTSDLSSMDMSKE